MTTAALVAPGVLDTPGAVPYPDGMDIITDPAKLPADRAKLPGDTLIGPAVWAALQRVELATVYRNHTLAGQRRTQGTTKRGDMPAPVQVIGQTPVWTVADYRAWAAARPGRGAGAGRPRRDGPPPVRQRVGLPVACPHCHHEITAADLKAAKAAGQLATTAQAGRPQLVTAGAGS